MELEYKTFIFNEINSENKIKYKGFYDVLNISKYDQIFF